MPDVSIVGTLASTSSLTGDISRDGKAFVKVNFAQGFLASTLSASVTSASLTAGHSLPTTSGKFRLVIWNSSAYPNPADDPNVEIVTGEYISPNVYSVARAQEGTSDAEHATGSKIALNYTAGVSFNDLSWLGQDVSPDAAPTFAGGDFTRNVTLTTASFTGAVTLSGLTASRLVATDSSSGLASVADLASWVAGTANQVVVAVDGDGSITLSAPQNLHTGASPTFAGLVIADGGTIGQATGPLLTFDDTNNYLEITGANVGVGTATPGEKLDVNGNIRVGAAGHIYAVGTNELYLGAGTKIHILHTSGAISIIGTTSGAPIILANQQSTGPIIDFQDNGVSVFRINNGGNVGLNEAAPVTLLEATHTAPYITLHCDTHTDAANARASRLIARGEQSGGEETILGYEEFSHDGAADDEAAQWRLYLNDGNDGTIPTLRLSVDSAGNLITGTATISDTSGNLSSADGANFGPGAVSSITVRDGIITNIS